MGSAENQRPGGGGQWRLGLATHDDRNVRRRKGRGRLSHLSQRNGMGTEHLPGWRRGILYGHILNIVGATNKGPPARLLRWIFGVWGL